MQRYEVVHGPDLRYFTDNSELSSSSTNSLQDKVLGTTTITTTTQNPDIKGKSSLSLDDVTTTTTTAAAITATEEESKESNSPPTTPISNPRERMTYFEKPESKQQPWQFWRFFWG